MGVKERKERQKEKLKGLIISAATDVFVKEGFEAASIRKIAAKIEYSPSTLYLYFKDKNEIFSQIQETALEKFVAKLDEFKFIKDPIARLKSLAQSYLDFAVNNKALYTLMFGDQPKIVGLSKTDWPPGKKSFELIEKQVELCLVKSQFKKITSQEATLIIWSYLHGMAALAINQRLFIAKNKQQMKEYIKNTTEKLIDVMRANYL